MPVTDMQTAVEEAVTDGDAVYLAGFTQLIPYAAGHEIIRQGYEDLVLCRAVPDMIYDQMIAAGCARKAIFSAATPGVRRVLENDGIPFEEYTHYGMVSRLAAGAYGLPFLPVRTFTGSDLPKHNDRIKTVSDPYGTGDIHTVPPLNPDVTFVHVQRASKDGTGQAWGILGEIIDATLAADTVVLSAEELVSTEVIRSDPNRSVIPGSEVDYVVEEPYCAHPSYVMGYYDRDRQMDLDWPGIADTHDGVLAYLDEWVYGVTNRETYVEKMGVEWLRDLAVSTEYATPINMGGYE